MVGDTGLRARLVQVGVDLVRSDGAATLTLREIARRAGVSHGAPRRYFPTHLALLSEIARTGFADLTAQITQTLADCPDDPRARLAALARRYVDFGCRDRGMFELMFRHDLLESNHLGLRDSSLPLFEMAVDLISRARPGTGTPPTVLAGALWTNLHGIVELRNWGSLRLATGTDDVEPLLHAALEAHLGPMRPSP
ncbi:TetR/AcrR family transcriptional regulator [Jidongwangia harbinensis]|uniref:TetR/AcrR family transcriptional regulator n=1 Tax=Jidongwangia harbinensis TaxID=2878561 RepID=UPI001CD9A7A3|nr:TetR/AcrR family transcriptional regulator [Jidongwangia harbinensis]MCA2213510.1 TetR/AcrR family transcriptional regulator [Jidongwangia harbinensis]